VLFRSACRSRRFLTDSAGGFLVPFEIDFSVNITNAGSINPLLQISRVVSTVTDVWHGISSAGPAGRSYSWLDQRSRAGQFVRPDGTHATPLRINPEAHRRPPGDPQVRDSPLMPY
jgi:hypothetical protein